MVYKANELNHTGAPFMVYLGSSWDRIPTWDAADHHTLNNTCWYYISDITNCLRKMGWKCLSVALSLWDKIFIYFSLRIKRLVLIEYFFSRKFIQFGVTNGLVLIPLLFIVYISDLPDHVKSICKIFADYKSFSQFLTKKVSWN